MKQLLVSTSVGDRKDVKEVKLDLPNMCPYCSTSFNPKGCNVSNYHVYEQNEVSARIFSVMICPSCERLFMAEFYSLGFSDCSLLSIIPSPNKPLHFPDNICNLSKRYCEVYRQAAYAEEQGLTEICGLGYRKALEILVKDYAIHKGKDKKDVERCNLSDCINNYIDNPKLKTLAKASSLIGNDEAHYLRKITDGDVQSMKSFIKALESFIDSELEVYAANDLLKNNGKPTFLRE